jgi:hypothetical protein
MLNNSVKTNLKREVIIHSLKIIDISIITILYFVIGFVSSYYINKMYSSIKINYRLLPKWVIFIEVCGQLAVIAILVYIIRNLINSIPLPFDGFYGYQHSRVKELNSGGIALGFGLFYGQSDIKEKMEYIFGK